MNPVESPVVAVATPAHARLREAWARELYSLAEILRRTGSYKRLRDVTITHPIDCTAVAAIYLVCQALAGGEFSAATNEFDEMLDRVAADADAADRFLPAVRSIARRAASSDRR
jgi:hypothetical protein